MKTKYEGILAIDPGISATGWAIMIDKRLEACGLLRADDLNMVESIQKLCYDLNLVWEKHMSGTKPPEYMVIEKPQVYQQRLSKGDPNDLIPLAIIGGAAWITMKPKHVSFPLPRQWKGQVPKKVLFERVFKDLSKREENILKEDSELVPANLRHNVYDAVCLGKWAVERFMK